MTDDSRQFSLAYLTLLGTPPRQMIRIAAEAGYDFVSLRLAPVTSDEERFPFTTDSSLVADVNRALDEYGLSVLDVELVRTDPGTSVADFIDFAEVAAELGARHIITQIPEPDRGRAVGLFTEVCELAESHGMTADLEFIPWSPTTDLQVAAEIVTTAARPNGGVLIDTLHFDRSKSSVDQIAGLPHGLFNFIQLCDAQAQPSNNMEDLIYVARFDRQPPGAGCIDLASIVAALPRVPYALEVPNDYMREKLGDLGYAQLVLNATKGFLETVELDATAAAG